MLKRLSKIEQYNKAVEDMFREKFTTEQLKQYKEILKDKDKIQWRDETAQELGMSIAEITILAKIVGVPRSEAITVGRRFTRQEFKIFLQKYSDKPKYVIADILNISKHSLSILLKQLE